MPRCPHCGETVRAGQERCFACGQNVRGGRRSRSNPYSGRIILVVAILVLLGGVGLVIGLSARPAQQAKRAESEELQRVQDSVRAANRALRDTARSQRRDAATDRLIVELDRIEDRFTSVKKQVVVGNATPEQQKLISGIQAQLGRIRSLAQGLSGKPQDEAREKTESEVRDGMRDVRAQISQLTRAPRNKPAPTKTP
jgi:hypothetical protein